MATTSPSPSLAGPMVDVDWVAARLSDERVRMIEVDVAPTDYEQGHIPGALLWNVYRDLRHPDYTPVATDELRDLVARSGIDRETTVVCYGYGAHLGYWLLRSHGHTSVLLLDGDREQWLASGRPWGKEKHEPAPAEASIGERDPRLGASREDVLAMIGKPDGVILDVRSLAEYDGVNFWPSGAAEPVGRPGHVPGGVHLPIETLRDADGTFKGAGEMERALEAAGVSPEHRVVTYCTVGNRAAQAWFALSHLLGYPDTAVYCGSWAEWGFRTDAPID